MKLEKKKQVPKTQEKLHKRYPQFAFRIPSNEGGADVIAELNDYADRIKERRNKEIEKEGKYKLISRNDVLLEALRTGLKALLTK